MDELKVLYKVYTAKTIYPKRLVIKNPSKNKNILSTEYTVMNRKEVAYRIKTIENAKIGKFRCFFCNKFYKEGKGGRYIPMDKRERGDNGFGDTFVCNHCCGHDCEV
jgi:hypothetical protein